MKRERAWKSDLISSFDAQSSKKRRVGATPPSTRAPNPHSKHPKPTPESPRAHPPHSLNKPYIPCDFLNFPSVQIWTLPFPSPLPGAKTPHVRPHHPHPASYAALGKPILHDLTLTLTKPASASLARTARARPPFCASSPASSPPPQDRLPRSPDPARDRKAALARIGILVPEP